MLRFPKKPDSVFLAILYAALEIRRDMVRELAEEGNAEEWHEDSPRLARYLTSQTLVSVLDRLLDALRDSRVYELTDYHWLTGSSSTTAWKRFVISSTTARA
jgi:hypothetical protein